MTATLIWSTSSQYDRIYWDKGSGAKMDVTIFRPKPPVDSEWFIIGDYAQGNYSPAYGAAALVSVHDDDPANPLLMPPTKDNSYSQVWNDMGSGGDMNGSIWYPNPPAGYVSVGFVGQSGYDEPVIPTYMCIREDQLQTCAAGPLIWWDEGSGAHLDVSLYAISQVENAFVAQGNYQPYSGLCYSRVTTSNN